MGSSQLAELTIPARAEFVSLARLVVSSVADDRYALTDEQLDNLKLAVSEACVIAIDVQQDVGDGVIGIACSGGRDRLEVVVNAGALPFGRTVHGRTASDLEGRPPGHELGLSLIGSLVDDLTVDDDGHVHITIHCEPNEDF